MASTFRLVPAAQSAPAQAALAEARPHGRAAERHRALVGRRRARHGSRATSFRPAMAVAAGSAGAKEEAGGSRQQGAQQLPLQQRPLGAHGESEAELTRRPARDPQSPARSPHPPTAVARSAWCRAQWSTQDQNKGCQGCGGGGESPRDPAAAAEAQGRAAPQLAAGQAPMMPQLAAGKEATRSQQERTGQ